MKKFFLTIIIAIILMTAIGCSREDKFSGVWSYNDMKQMEKNVQADPYYSFIGNFTVDIDKRDKNYTIKVIESYMSEMNEEYVMKGRATPEDIKEFRKGHMWGISKLTPNEYTVKIKDDTMIIKFAGAPEPYSSIELTFDGNNMRMTKANYYGFHGMVKDFERATWIHYTKAEYNNYMQKFQNIRADALEKNIKYEKKETQEAKSIVKKYMDTLINGIAKNQITDEELNQIKNYCMTEKQGNEVIKKLNKTFNKYRNKNEKEFIYEMKDSKYSGGVMIITTKLNLKDGDPSYPISETKFSLERNEQKKWKITGVKNTTFQYEKKSKKSGNKNKM